MAKLLITLESIEIERDDLKREVRLRKVRRNEVLVESKVVEIGKVVKIPIIPIKKYKRTPAQSLLSRIRRRAEHKGMDCELTLDDCTDLPKCYYCGTESTGFDRIDSSYGYTHKNTVAACGLCNRMKWTLGQDDFIDHCKWIASRF